MWGLCLRLYLPHRTISCRTICEYCVCVCTWLLALSMSRCLMWGLCLLSVLVPSHYLMWGLCLCVYLSRRTISCRTIWCEYCVYVCACLVALSDVALSDVRTVHYLWVLCLCLYLSARTIWCRAVWCEDCVCVCTCPVALFDVRTVSVCVLVPSHYLTSHYQLWVLCLCLCLSCRTIRRRAVWCEDCVCVCICPIALSHVALSASTVCVYVLIWSHYLTSHCLMRGLCLYLSRQEDIWSHYGVATINRLLQIIGLFCRK